VDHLNALYYWLSSIADRLSNLNCNKTGKIAKEIGEFVNQYSRFCQEAHQQLDSLCVNGNLEPNKLRQIKQDWNHVRDKHNQTIKTWEDIAKNLNSAAGEQICFDSFESLKTIE
jgi:hypothetical protein